MAGLAIFPIIFANGMNPGQGPGLIFMGLPLAFQAMPFGTLFGVLFFVMLSMAALTSSISMIEATVAWLVASKGLTRKRASWGVGIVLWLVSTLAMLSFNMGADWTFAGRTFFDWLDYLTSRWMMPLGGLGMALMAGFLLRTEIFRAELGLSRTQHALWLFMVRYVSPLGIVLIFIDTLGLATLQIGTQWPWLLALLVLITVVGEFASPRLRQPAS
jgi:NSS family neurotransmitter:Na+ symporter